MNDDFKDINEAFRRRYANAEMLAEEQNGSKPTIGLTLSVLKIMELIELSEQVTCLNENLKYLFKR